LPRARHTLDWRCEAGDVMRGWARIVVAVGFFPALAFAQDAPQGDAAQKKTVGRPHDCEHYFPQDLRYDGAQGETTLAFMVTADGHVSDINVTKSSGNDELDAAAVTCASHWLYKLANPDAAPKAVPWGATVAWSVPRQDIARQIHRDTKPVAPTGVTEGKP
jgi:TonB family protein